MKISRKFPRGRHWRLSIFRTTGTTLSYPILELVLDAPASEAWILSPCLSSILVWLDCAPHPHPKLLQPSLFPFSFSYFYNKVFASKQWLSLSPSYSMSARVDTHGHTDFKLYNSAGHHQIDPCPDLCSTQSIQPSMVGLLAFAHHFACCCSYNPHNSPIKSVLYSRFS